MRVTRGQLRRIIREEKVKLLKEASNQPPSIPLDPDHGVLSVSSQLAVAEEAFDDDHYFTRERLIKAIVKAEYEGWGGIMDWMLEKA